MHIYSTIKKKHLYEKSASVLNIKKNTLQNEAYFFVKIFLY